MPMVWHVRGLVRVHRGCASHVVVRMALLRATTASKPLRLPPARHCDLTSNQLVMGDQPSGNEPRAKRNRKPATSFVPGETALRSRPTQQESAFKQLQPAGSLVA